LIWKHEVAPNPSYTRDAGTSDVFKSGRAAMYTAGRWMCMQFKDIDSFDWEVTTLPRGKGAATTLFTAALAISTQSKFPKDAFTLLKFLLNNESQSTLANAGLAIPVRQDVASAPAFMKPSAFPPGLAIDHGANIRCVPDARVPPHSAIWPELRQRVADRLDRVFTNQETAREALIALQRPLEKLLQEQAEKH
jgi:multiple sugar transport system substrate-binding protein